jgi:hypothetical protein
VSASASFFGRVVTRCVQLNGGPNDLQIGPEPENRQGHLDPLTYFPEYLIDTMR